MARTNTPQEYAQAVLSEIKRQKNREDNKQLQSLKKENDKLFSEVTKLKEQAKVLQSEAKKVSKLETKLSNEISKSNERQRRISNLNRAVVGLKREWRTKFDNLKEDIAKNRAKKTDKQEGREDAVETKESAREKAKALKRQQGETKRLLKAFQRQTLDPESYDQHNRIDIIDLKKKIDKLPDSAFKDDMFYGFNKVFTSAIKKEDKEKISAEKEIEKKEREEAKRKLKEERDKAREETKRQREEAKQAKEADKEAKRKLKEEQALDKAKKSNIKSYDTLDKTLDKINNKLNLFALALGVKWTLNKHEKTQAEIQASYRAGLNLQQGKEWMAIARAFGASGENILQEISELRQQKDLIERGGKIVFTEEQQKFLFSGLKNSLNVRQEDFLGLSPQQLYAHILDKLWQKVKSNTGESASILAGAREMGFSELAYIVQRALIDKTDLTPTISRLKQAVDIPLGTEKIRTDFAIELENVTQRLLNVFERLINGILFLSKPLLKWVGELDILATSSEKAETANKLIHSKTPKEERELLLKMKSQTKLTAPSPIENFFDSGKSNIELAINNLKDMSEDTDDRAFLVKNKAQAQVILNNVKRKGGLDRKEKRILNDFIKDLDKENTPRSLFLSGFFSALKNNDLGLADSLLNNDSYIPYMMPKLDSGIAKYSVDGNMGYITPENISIQQNVTIRDETKNGVNVSIESPDNVRFINQ